MTVTSTSTIDELRQLIGGSEGDRVDVASFSTPGDGGGGEFYWDISTSAGDDGGTVIVPVGSTTGRWVRIVSFSSSSEADARWWGVRADGSANPGDQDALNAAITATAGRCVLRLPSGVSILNDTVVIPSYARIVGPGATYDDGSLAGAWWQWGGADRGGPVCSIGSTTQTKITEGIALEDFGISGGQSSQITLLAIEAGPHSNGATTNVRGRGLAFNQGAKVLTIAALAPSGPDGPQADFLRFEQCRAFNFADAGIYINSDNGADESVFSEWYFYGAKGSTAVEIDGGSGFVEFNNMSAGGPVSSCDFMFKINQSYSNNVTIRNCEQENCAFLYVSGGSDLVTIALHSNTINPPRDPSYPSIVVTGYNRLVGVGNQIRGGIDLQDLGAKYVGVMDRIGPTAPGFSPLSQNPNAVFVNFETMHADATDRLVIGSDHFVSPAGQITLHPGSNHPELRCIVGDVCTRTGGRCLTWAKMMPVSDGYLCQPTVDNGRQYVSKATDGKGSGTTGQQEPTWPAPGAPPVVDGSCSWTDAGVAGVFQGFGPLDHYKLPSPPQSGQYRVGSVVWNESPQAGEFVGWVCTKPGYPPTWNGFGLIAP